MKHPPLSDDEEGIFKVTVAVFQEWAEKPRSRERSGAQSAIGAVWNRLGWTMRGLDEVERLAKERR